MVLRKKINIYTCSAYYFLRRELKKYSKPKFVYDKADQKRFETIISNIPANRVFVHIAQSSIKKFSPNSNSYDYLKNILLDNFHSIVTNAFTPQVRKTKHFNPIADQPVYGAFSKLLFRDSTFRNHDPLYSVSGIGDTCLRENDFSFTKNGVFKQMIDNDYFGLNIDIGNITSSLLHYIELNRDLPYINLHREKFFIEKKDGIKEVDYSFYS